MTEKPNKAFNSEWVIENFEYDERQELGEKMRKAFDRGDMEEAQEFFFEILDKWGQKERKETSSIVFPTINARARASNINEFSR